MRREMTWADIDRLNAEREAKKVELVERLTKVLVREFNFSEIKFIRGIEFDSIRVEAFERARNELEAKK
jgi:hypothetical protein